MRVCVCVCVAPVTCKPSVVLFCRPGAASHVGSEFPFMVWTARVDVFFLAGIVRFRVLGWLQDNIFRWKHFAV